MTSGRKPAARHLALAVAAGSGLWLAAAGALAQAPGAPAALPSAPAKPAAQKPSPPRPAIQLTPAERQTIDAVQAGKDRPARVEDALAPTPEDMKPRAADDTPNTTRIEQLHQSNRVSEVIVTPSGQSRSYVMQNREGQQPFGTTQMNSGLSVPMFFRFEFGRSTPPATSPPSPPAPPPSR
jgi:arylamine N-acetyltransferase